MESFDVVIVGAGSAGATLAARLSEDPQRSVCLLEAGPDYRSADAPPEMSWPNPRWIVDDKRFPQYQYPQLLARRTRVQKPRLYWRGRGMGGSSAINGEIAIRAVPEDLDDWAADGCKGWSYRETLPFFCRLEDEQSFGDRPWHGTGGPIPIYRAPVETWGAADRALREGALSLGYPWAEDTEEPGATGVSPYAINSRDGRRVSTNDAYLEPARARPNLQIRGDALVDRVLFDGRVARALRVRRAGRWSEIAAGAVVLSAGAVHTPGILIRSGVGPADALRGLGIGARVDLPVGEGFQDHALAVLWADLSRAHHQGVRDRHTNCCVRYSSGLADAGVNDMMMVSLNDGGGFHEGEQEIRFGGIGVWVNRCFSRGRLWLESADPEADPSIDENMLSDERDVVRMRDGIRRLVDVMKTDAVAAISEGIRITHSGGRLEDLATDDAIDGFALHTCADTQHATGTCRMGPPDAATTVVDPDCRVLGTEALRVIDASVMPTVPRANTHLTTVMIAERMAERLRSEL